MVSRNSHTVDMGPKFENATANSRDLHTYDERRCSPGVKNRSEESARTLIVLDVDGYSRKNEELTHMRRYVLRRRVHLSYVVLILAPERTHA